MTLSRALTLTNLIFAAFTLYLLSLAVVWWLL